MTNYTDFNFYLDKYKGNMPEDDFDKFVIRASAEVRKHIFNRDIKGYEEEVRMATCSVADILYKIEQIEEKQSKNTQITSKKVADLSINYASVDLETEKANLKTEIIKEIRLYLGPTGLLYRGV